MSDNIGGNNGRFSADPTPIPRDIAPPPYRTLRDRLIDEAHNVPSLIALAAADDPVLAQALIGKALVASKSVWGPLVGAALSWVVTRYGLAWDESTSAEVTGGIILVVSAAIRMVTVAPIVSILPQKDPTP